MRRHARTLRLCPSRILDVLEPRLLLSSYNHFTTDAVNLDTGLAVYRPTTGLVYVDTNRDGAADRYYGLGTPGDVMAFGDVNGDGLTDPAVYRSGTWYVDTNRDGAADAFYRFGIAGDVPLIGDVNNDGLGDLIVFRSGTWYVCTGRDGVVSRSDVFGQAGDKPVVGDFDGDGRLDRAVYRPSEGKWYLDSDFHDTVSSIVTFGGNPADIPFTGDFNDDKIADLGIFRNGTYFIDTTRTGSATITSGYGTAGDLPTPAFFTPAAASHTLRTGLATFNPTTAILSIDATQSGSVSRSYNYGAGGDIPVAGDFDGNTVTDTAVYRNGWWFIDTNHDAGADQMKFFGNPGDIPLAGDFNRDGRDDMIIFRSGTWYIDTNADGIPDSTSSWGIAGDKPVVGDFNNDGYLDRAVYRNGTWFVDYSFDGVTDGTFTLGGQAGDKPFAFDFNNDGKTDMGVYRNGTWLVDLAHNGTVSYITGFGNAGDIPLPGVYDTSRSLFVRAGANGNGTEAAPFGSISAAANAASPGTLIRIAPGTYNEQVTVNGKNNISFLANNRFATIVSAAAGNGFTLNDDANIYIRNISALSADTTTTLGKGFYAYNTSLFATGVRAVGSRMEGIYGGAVNGKSTLLYVRDADVSQSKRSAGLLAEWNERVWLTNVAANAEGQESTGQGPQWGRGVVVDGTNNRGLLRYVSGSYNADHGLILDGTADFAVQNSTFSNNPNRNGAIINNNVNLLVESCTFENNGTIHSVFGGYNGLEIDDSATAPVVIRNSIIRNNTAFGLYLGAGKSITVQNNTFENNTAQLFINGVNYSGTAGNQFVTGDTTAYVYGNSFRVDPGTQAPGVTGAGGGGSAYVGGAATWQKNTFTNFPTANSIFVNRSDINDPATTVKIYCLPLSSNNFVNSPNPVGGYGALTLP